MCDTLNWFIEIGLLIITKYVAKDTRERIKHTYYLWSSKCVITIITTAQSQFLASSNFNRGVNWTWMLKILVIKGFQFRWFSSCAQNMLLNGWARTPEIKKQLVFEIHDNFTISDFNYPVSERNFWNLCINNGPQTPKEMWCEDEGFDFS